jgi:hypothetical protein
MEATRKNGHSGKDAALNFAPVVEAAGFALSFLLPRR